MLTEAAYRNNVPARLLHGIVMVESHYHCGARNGGSLGIGQVKPATARAVGVTGNLLDCRTGLEAAARYLRLTLDRAGGDWTGAATLYNQGVAATPRRSAYSNKVMRFAMEDNDGRLRTVSK